MPIRMISPEKRKARRGGERPKHGGVPRGPRQEDLIERFGGGEKGKPHSSREGRVATGRRRIDRYRKKAETVGSSFPSRKLIPNQDRKKFIIDALSGGREAKPHSTKEGRIASGKRKIKRLFGEKTRRPKTGPRPGRPDPGRPWARPKPKPRPLPSPGPGLPQRPDPSSPWRHKERIMTPLRTKKFAGSIVKKIITKIKPKPPGVFKKGFTVTETKKGKPHWTQEGQDASIKRKFKRASDAHQKKLKAKREDKAAGGRIGLRHGGSAGAAKRGHGAEIK